MLKDPPNLMNCLVMLCLVLASLLWMGFTSKRYVVVGTVDSLEEFFTGRIHHNLLTGKATVSVTSKTNGVHCQGQSVITASQGTKNLVGKLSLTCTDGRQLTGDWTAPTMRQGAGQGSDNQGRTFRFVFGLPEDDARTELLKTKPATPEAEPKMPANPPESPPNN